MQVVGRGGYDICGGGEGHVEPLVFGFSNGAKKPPEIILLI